MFTGGGSLREMGRGKEEGVASLEEKKYIAPVAVILNTRMALCTCQMTHSRALGHCDGAGRVVFMSPEVGRVDRQTLGLTGRLCQFHLHSPAFTRQRVNPTWLASRPTSPILAHRSLDHHTSSHKLHFTSNKTKTPQFCFRYRRRTLIHYSFRARNSTPAPACSSRRPRHRHGK